MAYTTEHNIRVYNDDNGSYISVSPDADAMDFVELREVEPDNKIVARLTMMPEQAKAVFLAVREYLNRHTKYPID